MNHDHTEVCENGHFDCAVIPNGRCHGDPDNCPALRRALIVRVS